jgi:hypothetical protein
MGCNKKLAVEKRHDTHLLCNEEEEKWIEDYVVRETAGASKTVEDAEAAGQQEQDYRIHADITVVTSGEHENTFEQMLVAI